MVEKYGFIYIWFDKKHKRFYIGSHWGTEDDGYICSSRWMRKSFRRRPEDFKRRILTNNINDRKEVLIIENKWLKLIKNDELGVKYYNLQNKDFNHWSSDPDKLLTISEKLSKANKGVSRNKGRKLSEETKQKIRESLKGRKLSEETLAKRNGHKKSEETKQKMREAHKRENLSEETLLKMSQASSGRKLSDEHKTILIESRIGSKHSDESKNKMSDALKGKIPWNKGLKVKIA